MKNSLKFIVIFIFVLNSFVVPVFKLSCEEGDAGKKNGQIEQMQKYSKEIEKNIAESVKCLDEQRTFFVEDKTEQKYIDYNKSILEMKEYEIDLMKKMVKAAISNDVSALERLEQEKNKISREINLIELKKEKEYVLNTYNENHRQYIDDKKIKSGLKLVEQSYDDIITAQEAQYEAEQNLKNAYDRKDKAVKLMDIYFLEAQKNKKINELGK
ncbi:hypothetical protein J7L67_01310 [bacterium]|nr:hypothetical protein [bacterium]